MKTEGCILHEQGDHWVTRNARGDYEVFKNGTVASTRCATIGRNLPDAFERAKAECARREVLSQAGAEKPRCDMKKTCPAPVTHIGEKGCIYCAHHALDRRGHERCRRMRVWELKLIQQGKPLPRFSLKPVPSCVASMGCLCAGHARGINVSEPCDTREVQS